MSSGFMRLSALSAVVLAVAGCGGGSGGSTGGGGGGGTPTTVTFEITGGTADAAAAKIGSGAFAATTVTSGTVSLSIPSGTTNFAVAIHCTPLSQTVGSITHVTTSQLVFEASTADGTSFTKVCPSAPPTPATGVLTGSVDASAIAGVNTIGVTAAGSTLSRESLIKGVSSTFSLNMPAGTDRVAVAGYTNTQNSAFGPSATLTLAAIRNFDGVAVPGSVNGGAAVVLGAADTVTPQTITYKNVPGNYSAPTTIALYIFSGLGAVTLSNAATSTYPAVPSAVAEAGDQYRFSASSYNQMSSGNQQMGLEQMHVETTSTSGGPQTFTFPAPWSYTGPVPAALPSFNMSYTGFSGQTGVLDYALINWQSGTGGMAQNIYQVSASANYLNGSTTLAVPDLSGVPGFLPPPPSKTSVGWTAGIGQYTDGLAPANRAGNSVVVENIGTFQVP